MKRIVMFALAMPVALAAHAEEFYQPRVEAQVFYVNAKLDPALTTNDFSAGTGPSASLPKLRGNGGAARLSLSLSNRVRLVGEAGLAKTDRRYSDQGVRYQIENTQARGGIRFVRAASNGMPVYAEAGADFAYYELTDKVFSSSAANASSYRGKKDGAYGVGHLAAGYRSKTFHGYGDIAYGMGQNDDLFEITLGSSYALATGLHLVAEYRVTTLEDNDGDIKNNELRFGLGLQF